jgi:hypothetical protein
MSEEAKGGSREAPPPRDSTSDEARVTVRPTSHEDARARAAKAAGAAALAASRAAPAGAPAVAEVRTLTPERVEETIRDAALLLRYSAQARIDVPDAVTATIATCESLLEAKESISTVQWTSLVRAYAELATLTGPVTATSLRATQETTPAPGAGPAAPSIARAWSRTLLGMAVGVGLFILIAENVDRIIAAYFQPDEQSGQTGLWVYGLNIVLQSILPFAYGGLGAATYLLRSAHEKLHARTFDPIFVPEYYNRLVIGLIAGGTIELLASQVGVDDGVLELSAIALAFVAGYNAELLFKAVERVSEALLPKIGLDSVKVRAPSPAGPAMIRQLVEAANSATDEKVRDAIRVQIEKAQLRF